MHTCITGLLASAEARDGEKSRRVSCEELGEVAWRPDMSAMELAGVWRNGVRGGALQKDLSLRGNQASF
jgi:hypothetical protein